MKQIATCWSLNELYVKVYILILVHLSVLSTKRSYFYFAKNAPNLTFLFSDTTLLDMFYIFYSEPFQE